LRGATHAFNVPFEKPEGLGHHFEHHEETTLEAQKDADAFDTHMK
jgi:hypothetical protein